MEYVYRFGEATERCCEESSKPFGNLSSRFEYPPTHETLADNALSIAFVLIPRKVLAGHDSVFQEVILSNPARFQIWYLSIFGLPDKPFISRPGQFITHRIGLARALK